MRRGWLLLLLLAFPGCGDREGQGEQAAEERAPSWARRRPVAPSTTVVAGVVVDAPKPLAGAEAAVGSPLYGGRALFDGDPRFLGASETPAVAVPSGGGEKKVVYTAAARKPTLTISEPPAPSRKKRRRPEAQTSAASKKERADYSRASSRCKCNTWRERFR